MIDLDHAWPALRRRACRRMGVTMRVAHGRDCREPRDCLAQDWADFLADSLPGIAWLPLPNLGGRVLEYARAWGLEGFILTGGNDLGERAERDATEQAVLEFAFREGMPVFGVCRGLQMVQHFFGGAVTACAREAHVGVAHDVTLGDPIAEPGAGSGGSRRVNSFHNFGVRIDALASPLRPFAVTADGLAEGIIHRDSPLVAVQWHPERMRPYAEPDRKLLRDLFLPS